MRTWADEVRADPPALTIRRDLGEGPPRCCDVMNVAADELVRYDPTEVPPAVWAAVRRRFPRYEAAGMFLCGGCRSTLEREEVVARRDQPRTRPPREDR